MPWARNMRPFHAERRPRGGHRGGTRLVELFFHRTRSAEAPDKANYPDARTDIEVIQRIDGDPDTDTPVTLEVQPPAEGKGARPWIYFRWHRGDARVKTYLERPAGFFFGTRMRGLARLTWKEFERKDARGLHVYEVDHTSKKLPGCQGSVLSRTLEVVTRVENARREAARLR